MKKSKKIKRITPKKTPKKTSKKTSKKTLKKQKKKYYYLIHNNGGRSFVVVIENKNVKVYKTLDDDEIEKEKNTLEFIDYTDDDINEKVIVSNKPVFILKHFKNIFIGYDIDFRDIIIENKKFGKGNSILVFDGKYYYSIYCSSITKFNSKNIKGKVTGYISPIGPSDVPYPIMFTTTHLYSWCVNIDEHKLDKKDNKLIQFMCKLKNPLEIPKNKTKIIDDFLLKYTCEETNIVLKGKNVYEF